MPRPPQALCITSIVLVAALSQLPARAESSAVTHANLGGAFAHVVVVVQENRTVDNLFNGFPGADTVATGMRFGKPVALQPIALEPSIDPDHSHQGFATDYDNGKMDGFDHEYKNSSSSTYAYVQQSDVQNYWTLASRFTLADEVFQMNMGPSFSAHVNLVAAQAGYPLAFNGNPTTKGGPGCFGAGIVTYIDMRKPFPGTPLSNGPACQDMPTIFDLLDAKGIGWRYYAPSSGFGAQLWSAPDYITHIAEGPDIANLVHPESQIIADIASGTLPAVSYVVPQMCSSDHPHGPYADPLAGPHWVAAIANAIGASQYWGDTLILITWDDWGGWYDHKTPGIINDDNYGFRTPLLIVSAYPANPGTPDHTTRTQASIMTAIESIFGLPSLGQLDAKSDDLRADFNFGSPVPYGSALPSAIPPPNCTAP